MLGSKILPSDSAIEHFDHTARHESDEHEVLQASEVNTTEKEKVSVASSESLEQPLGRINVGVTQITVKYTDPVVAEKTDYSAEIKAEIPVVKMNTQAETKTSESDELIEDENENPFIQMLQSRGKIPASIKEQRKKAIFIFKTQLQAITSDEKIKAIQTSFKQLDDLAVALSSVTFTQETPKRKLVQEKLIGKVNSAYKDYISENLNEIETYSHLDRQAELIEEEGLKEYNNNISIWKYMGWTSEVYNNIHNIRIAVASEKEEKGNKQSAAQIKSIEPITTSSGSSEIEKKESQSSASAQPKSPALETSSTPWFKNPLSGVLSWPSLWSSATPVPTVVGAENNVAVKNPSQSSSLS